MLVLVVKGQFLVLVLVLGLVLPVLGNSPA